MPLEFLGKLDFLRRCFLGVVLYEALRSAVGEENVGGGVEWIECGMEKGAAAAQGTEFSAGPTNLVRNLCFYGREELQPFAPTALRKHECKYSTPFWHHMTGNIME